MNNLGSGAKAESLTAALSYAELIARTIEQSVVALKAVVIHGSIAFGDFVPGRSDLDMLVIADIPERAIGDVGEAVQSVSIPPSAPALEMSIVSPDDLVKKGRLRPFQLHVNLLPTALRVVPGFGHEGDEDLTLHYAVAREVGIAIRGPNPRSIIPPQATASVASALVAELHWAVNEAKAEYVVLNACRALEFATDGHMVSKLQGWLWARRNGYPLALLDRAITAYLMGPTLDSPSELFQHRTAIEDLVGTAVAKLSDVANTEEDFDA
jgi:hypothetical protein